MERKEEEIKSRGTESLSDEELWFSASAANDLHTYDAYAAYRRFKRHTAAPRVSLNRRWRWLYGAAAVILLLVVGGVAYYQGGQGVKSGFADIVVEAPPGSSTKLTLPDGSQVWLNAGSRIAYSQGFGLTGRELRFEGEGYFEVRKNDDLPFAVRTADVDVTVVGTRFDFRNYPADEEVIVSLLDGKVAVDNRIRDMETRYLKPSDRMVLNKRTGEMTITTTEVQTAVEWTRGVLYFDEILLPDIVRELKRTYDVEIEIRNGTLETERFYGVFDKRKQDIREILDSFRRTGRLDYVEEKDGTFILQ